MAERKWTASQWDAITSRGKSVAVSAAAGSGKTAVLTRRIIERICAPDGSGDLSRLLVVTFTKAAAAELASRISDALSDELAKNPGNRHIRAQSLLVSSAPISTIHSFCLDLLRTNFQKLDLPADFSAAEETEIAMIMKRTAEDLISDFFEGETAPEEGRIQDFGHFSDMFGDVTGADKLSDTILSLYRSLSSTIGFLDEIHTFQQACRNAQKNGFDGSVWEASIRCYLIDFLEHYKQIFSAALEYIEQDDVYEKYAQAFRKDALFAGELLCLARDAGSYSALSEKISAYVPERLASLRGVSMDEKMNFYKEARADFSKEVRRIAKEYYSYSEDTLCEALDGTASALADLSVFLHAFELRFSREKRRRKLVTFADMERLTLSLLWDRENDAPSELARSLRDSYDEIYIDEYQDTNEIQDKIFRLISKEDNRFNVGDIKQSIYSFRGAEPSIFRSELDRRPRYEPSLISSAAKIFLSENFRSTAEILDFCNGIFEKLLNTGALRYGEEERLRCGSDRHGSVPELCLIAKDGEDADSEDDSDADKEAEYVAGRIAGLLSGDSKLDGTAIRPSDIAILLRSANTCSAAYENALKKRGIPCRNSAQAAFFESPEVLLVLSFLNVVDNPARDIDLAAALKSPLFGVTLDELLYIRRFEKEGTLFDALRRFTEETGFAKGKKFLRERETYAAYAAEWPCDRLIWQIYTETGIFSILASDREQPIYEMEQTRANLMMLYQYAHGFERGGFKGLSGFISFINEVIADKAKMDVSQFASPGEVVSIMTIHKSKGLEFPVCFVCGLSRRFHFPELREKVVYHARLGVAMKLVSPSGLVRLDTPLRTGALLELRRLAVEEEMRVLYVALTRARERLILTASVRAKDLDSQDGGPLCHDGRYALAARFFSSYSERRAGSYLELLLAAAADIQDRFRLVLPQREDAGGKNLQTQLPEAQEKRDELSYYEAKRQIAERLDFDYPYRRLSKIPSKLSVSKLYPDVLDEEQGAEAEISIPTAVAMPHFLMKEPEEAVTAAERGTAMHTFMQFCDFALVKKNGVASEIDRLVEKQFLFETDRAKMDIPRLEAFFASRLSREMMASKRLYREKRFLIKYPASLFTSEDSASLAGEELLVQGVIDCAYFDPKNELILVDYKTDSFSADVSRADVESVLRQRHARQLGYYKLACEKLFGILPAHTYLYSFALNDVVEIGADRLFDKERN